MDRATVRAFYEAARAAGARDNGPPGLRPEYHPNYYGAFVLDPDGHNIEAVCQDSSELSDCEDLAERRRGRNVDAYRAFMVTSPVP